jgi:tetratricopeptide (TPR) repeat protein
MLDYLEQLIKVDQWEEALVIAEQLLLNKDNTLEDQVRINLALITARAWLGEYSGVVLLGDHAARMAADLENWEAYLTFHHYLGHAYSVLNQWAEAKRVWLNFVETLPVYGRDHLFEVMTWFHLGLASEKENDLQSAINYYLQARRVAEKNGNGRQILGVNHALIQAYTKQGNFSLVSPLLAKAAHYLRNNQSAKDWEKARLFHLQVRASFALGTRRYRRAKLIANRALSHQGSVPIHEFHMHMILATVAKNIGTPSEMVDHYLRARVSAIRARRYDFEVDAAESLYLFMQAHPGALEMSLTELPSHELPPAWFEMEGVPSHRPRT